MGLKLRSSDSLKLVFSKSVESAVLLSLLRALWVQVLLGGSQPSWGRGHPRNVLSTPNRTGLRGPGA